MSLRYTLHFSAFWPRSISIWIISKEMTSGFLFFFSFQKNFYWTRFMGWVGCGSKVGSVILEMIIVNELVFQVFVQDILHLPPGFGFIWLYLFLYIYFFILNSLLWNGLKLTKLDCLVRVAIIFFFLRSSVVTVQLLLTDHSHTLVPP